jgi:2-oxoglutarate dehydrogenase dihydrolipoamide succinyltransferase (E2 component)
MSVQVIMPQFGESVVEGTITKWLKAPGERVQEFEPLIEVNTDKVDTEVPSPANGVLLEILVPENTVARAGQLLARIGVEGESATPGVQAEAKPVTGTGEARHLVSAAASTTQAQAHPERRPGATQQDGSERNLGFISPVVAKIASERGVDLFQVKGTGLGGRITKKDILAYLEKRPQVEAAQPGEEALKGAGPAPQPPAIPMKSAGTAPLQAAPMPAALPGEILPLTPVRRAIAEHMSLSKRISPHVTTIMEADLGRVIAHRQANKEAFAKDGVNLTFTAYFVAAAVAALRAYPIVNSSWSEEGILLHRAVNIGMATSLGEAGLIAPVIKNADSLSLLGLARTINNLAGRARARQLKPEEVQGGTFTITNHGVSGSLFATPIINQPQSAILGVGAIQKRVMVVGDGNGGDVIAIRPMVYLGLTFDHRILDGAIADYFLGKVVETLQKWA